MAKRRTMGKPPAGAAPAAQQHRCLLSANLERVDSNCSFGNASFGISVHPGECVWLRGDSGVGKTQTALFLMGLQGAPQGTKASVSWDPTVPIPERAGMLFQNGVLIDALTVQENIELSAAASTSSSNHSAQKGKTAADFLSMVGLQATDAGKMPGQLSGGMLRRAALAQLLAQHKRLILLDEPFTGLDATTARGVIRQLQRAMKEQKTAFLLISHQEHLCQELGIDREIRLFSRLGATVDSAATALAPVARASHVFFSTRLLHKAIDYFAYSLPLIILCFCAAGGAIGMLFGDSLARTEVVSQILSAMDEHAKSWPAMMQMFLETAKAEVKKMADSYVPELKASLFCAGMTHLVVLEIAPLLTALLLAGRVGGSYAGEVGMMQATNQNRLLQTLGISPVRWSLLPTIFAALVAGPLLTVIAAFVALGMGSLAFGYAVD
eukprot:INCI5022.4.p1 GENE.INCI5022.4~~INCI5022.4.p1  ORF type:complete len:439 (-),score=74.84 INCI5022.4:509-1825(-)